MATSHFHPLPTVAFLNRVALPALILFLALHITVCLFYQDPSFRQAENVDAILPPPASAFQPYTEVVYDLTNTPSYCWTGNTVNDLQGEQCEDLWDHVSQVTLLGLAPFFGVGLAFFLAYGRFTQDYKKYRKKIADKKASFVGTVTRPAKAPEDFYSWFHCLEPIMIQLKDGKQVRVYYSSTLPTPNPGDTLAAFEMSRETKEKAGRYIAVLFTPHVTVIRGV